MDCRCFIFDLVILNVWLEDFDYENNTLNIEVSFNNTEFTIESCPEKPGEFKQGRTYEFKTCPEDLSLNLLNNPLKLKILANGEDIKGGVEFIWPREMLEKLERPNFIQYSHSDESDITLERVVTGKINIQYRLRVKCELSESEEDNVEKRCDIQNELKRIVDPNELFFLIQSDLDICDTLNDVSKRNESHPTALDLSKFKNFHGKVVKDPGLIDQVYTPDCCHTKGHDNWSHQYKCVRNPISLVSQFYVNSKEIIDNIHKYTEYEQISQLRDGNRLILAKSKKIALIFLKVNNFANTCPVTVTVNLHERLNESKGVVYAPCLIKAKELH